MAASIVFLDNFDGTDGSAPKYGLIADATGDLFGTTAGGGTNNDGTVFEITYSATTGYASSPTVLASFNLADGYAPEGSLIADANGDLFGTTVQGGTNGWGTVFEIANTASGYASTPIVLTSFGTGANPRGSLIADANGDLFGTTTFDGTYSAGTVFEIAKTATGYASTPTVLVNFNSLDGKAPQAGLLADAAGDLFGTTDEGGTGYGTAFEITKTANGYSSTPTILAFFSAATFGQFGGLIADANGDLFGTSASGGAYAGGAVYEIAKTTTGYNMTPIVLASFNGPVAHSGPELNTDGSYPNGSLIMDANGDLFGTTRYGGPTGQGVVFEIVKTGTGYDSTPTDLVTFNGSNGQIPAGNLLAVAGGNLVGLTEEGGAANDGTFFELTQSGFVVGPEVFSQVQAAASGLLANNFLWSNAANWTDGVPVNGDTAASHAAGVDDIAALTLSSLDLTDGGAVTVVAPILTIETLVGDSTTQLLADSAIPGSASTDIVIVDDIAATGGSYGAVGPDTAFTDTSATSPANASYTAADDGKLQVTNDLAIGGTAVGNLSVETGGTVTSVNGTIGTGTANAGVVVVDGAQSSWVMSGSLGIGVQGGAGAPSLTISDDASVTTTSNVNSYDYFYNGLLTIETGATLTQAGLDMHNAATLVVEGGAVLAETGNTMTGGLDPNGTVTFNDGTLVSPNADTVIGVKTGSGGSGLGTLTASDGSALTSFATALGEEGGDSGTLVLTGSTTSLTDTGGTGIDANSAGLNVGLDGTGHVTVEAGATLANPLAYIKVGQFAGTGTVLVTGSGSTLSAGGLLRVGDSGTGTLSAANGATVAAGQVQVSDYGSSVGTLDIDAGASLSTNSASTVNVGAQAIANSGTIDVAAGSFDIGVQGGSKGRVDVDGGTVTVQGDLTVGNSGAGSLSVEDGGVFSVVNADIGTSAGAGSVTLGVGGELIATAVHVGAQGVVNMAGGVLDPPDTVTIDAAGDISGYGTVTGSVVDNGSITATGGTLDLTGDVSGAGTLILTPDASLQLEGTIANTADIVFTGSDEALALGTTAEVDAPVSGLGDGDSIALEGQAVTSAIYDADDGQLAITGSGGAVFHLTLSDVHQQSDFSVVNGDVAVACFTSGTRIATTLGDVRVENLAIGDTVRTRFSGPARIKWIGHRRIDCRRHPNPRRVWPVRVRAGAFGDGAPCSDLFLSPDHAVFVDDVLIPVRYLINGDTIAQQPRAAVTYYHVELERHDVMFAEGLACESYLDTGNRSNFEGTPVVLHPDFSAWSWEARGCAPLVITGAALQAVRRRLQARAARAEASTTSTAIAVGADQIRRLAGRAQA
jgi:T5SS/PEP-CTERM-associated repeat protein